MPSVGGFGNLDITKNVLLPSVGSFNNYNVGGENNIIMPSVGHFCDYNITLSFVGFHAKYIFLSFVDFHTNYIFLSFVGFHANKIFWTFKNLSTTIFYKSHSSGGSVFMKKLIEISILIHVCAECRALARNDGESQ